MNELARINGNNSSLTVAKSASITDKFCVYVLNDSRYVFSRGWHTQVGQLATC